VADLTGEIVPAIRTQSVQTAWPILPSRFDAGNSWLGWLGDLRGPCELNRQLGLRLPEAVRAPHPGLASCWMRLQHIPSRGESNALERAITFEDQLHGWSTVRAGADHPGRAAEETGPRAQSLII